MDELTRLRVLVEATIGPVIVIGTVDNPIVQLQGGGSPDPAVLAPLVQFWRSGITAITFAEWQTLDAAMADDRTLRQMTRNQFIAQGQDVRDRQIFDVLTAHSKMIRALTRDKR